MCTVPELHTYASQVHVWDPVCLAKHCGHFGQLRLSVVEAGSGPAIRAAPQLQLTVARSCLSHPLSLCFSRLAWAIATPPLPLLSNFY